MRLPKRVFQANYQNFRFLSLANDSRYLQSRPLISSLKRQTAFSLNGIPSAFFMSSSQYLLPDPETLVWTPSDRFKETSTVAFFYHRTTLPLWTCSGLHLDIVLRSRPRLLPHLQFYLPYLILAAQAPKGRNWKS